jgi:glycosyltransferase involved in cell wall biosynthesis
MNNPLVSIIIPVYNTEKYVAEAIESALNQTYKSLEIILVDDGSNDRSVEIVKRTISDNSKAKLLLRNREPKGASTCRNIGIEASNGDYIIFLDADDILAPFCLDQRIKVFSQQNDLDFCVFLTKQFANRRDDMDRIINTLSDIDDITSFLSMSHPWHLTSVIWKKTSLNKLNGFNENYARLQDPELHLRALFNDFKYGKFYNYPVDCYYRLNYDFKFFKLKDDLINSYIFFIKYFQSLILLKNRVEYLEVIKKNTVPNIINSMSQITIDINSVNRLLSELKFIRIISEYERIKYISLFIINSNYSFTVRKIKYFIKKYFYLDRQTNIYF